MWVKYLLYYILVSILLTSCNDEFDLFNDDLDINSSWKEHTFIYSNINPSDSMHYIRINRGFLGDNFFDMANCIDSIQYKPEDISVEFQVLRNGVIKKSYLCSDTLIDKQPGEYFNTGKARSYYFKAKDIPNDVGYIYKLVVKTKSNKIITAVTHPVTGFQLTYCENYHGLIELTNNNYLVIRVIEPAYGQVYELYAKIYYHEILPGNIVKHYTINTRLDNLVYSSFLQEHQYDKQIYLGYYAENIMTSVIADIQSRGNVSVVSRKLDSLSYIINAGNNDMAYIYNNKVPTTGFDIDNVGYSNVKNGYGFFTSYVNILSKNYGFDTKSLDLVHNKYGDYGF